MSFEATLKRLRLSKGLTQGDLAKETGLAKSSISMYENGNRKPSFEVLETFADFFNVDMNTLMEAEKGISPDDLTPKEEREIAHDLEDMMHSMASAAYEGDQLEDVEAFKATIKAAMIQAKKLAKAKYTPKKYRK